LTTEAADNTALQTMAEAARDALEQPTLNIVADAGYSNWAQAEALEAQGIVAHIPANRAVNKQGEGGFFDRTSFAYDQASDTMRCPAGQTLRRKQLQRGKHRVMYAAEIGDCGTCVLKACCTASPRRFVARHLHEAALQRMRARDARVYAVAAMRRRVPLCQPEVPDPREAAVPAPRSMGCGDGDEPGDAGMEPAAGDEGHRERCSGRATGLRLIRSNRGTSTPKGGRPAGGASL